MSTYLAVNLAALLVPLLFSFHPALRFDRRFAAFWPACLFVAAVFIAWDIAFTRMGVWGFNPEHLSGTYFFNLPVEEVLFFVCIPYACVFTYHCFDKLGAPVPDPRTQKAITAALLILLAAGGLRYYGHTYTVTTFSLLAVTLAFLQFGNRAPWLGRFYSAYAVLLIPFFAVNGILTGLGLEVPVVWYDDRENMGLRLLTIPVEDVFYGMLLILWVVAGMEWLSRRQATGARAAG